MSDQKSFAYRVTHVKGLSEHVSQVFLEPEKCPLTFVAGQYVHVLHVDGSASLLSIANAPNSTDQLEFHLFHPHDNSYAQDLMRMAVEDKCWLLAGPFGHCTVHKLQTHMPILFLARGTGFAPIKAVIEELVKTNDCPVMDLYWYMPKHAAFYLQDLLTEWKNKLPHFSFQLIHDLQSQQSDYSFVTLRHDHLNDMQVYASGSVRFVHAGYEVLKDFGLQRGLFISDVFD